MGCEKLFCSCCETAYADGFADGFKSGFRIGYKRGFRSGYISGYLDGYEGYKPLPIYEREIARLIPEYKPLKLLEPIRLSCGCYSVCTCSYQYRIYGR
jgi:hypothetical protein